MLRGVEVRAEALGLEPGGGGRKKNNNGTLGP